MIRKQLLLNAYWGPINFQASALMTIAVQKALQQVAGANHTAVLAMLASIVGVISMLVPLIAGAISDRLRARGTTRRVVVWLGAVVNAAGVVWLVYTGSVFSLGAAVIVANLGQNVSAAAYQALIPEVVPQRDWGLASGYMGAMSLVGSVAGLAVAGLTSSATTFWWTSALVLGGALTLVWVHERPTSEVEHTSVSNWHDFAIAFVSRMCTSFGLALLMTFAFYFFSDALGVANPGVSMFIFGGLTLVGAIASSIVLGVASDRFRRTSVVAVAGIPMAIAILGFAFVPDMRWVAVVALFFGVGYGGFVSVGWALGIDSVPQIRNVARDLGIWGIAAGLPSVIAPAAGGWLLAHFASPLQGYRALFGVAGLSFVLGSLVVLWVGKRQWLRFPSFQYFVCLLIAPYYWTAYRIRTWGRLPRTRGATVFMINHQHDIDTTPVVVSLELGGPASRTVYSSTSRRLFEPGFMGERFAWLEWLLRRANWSTMFGLLGMLPIENEIRSRPISSFAWSIQTMRGDLPLTDVFEAEVVEKLGSAAAGKPLSFVFDQRVFRVARTTYVPLHDVNEPYRSELIEQLRSLIESDLARIESVVARGETFFLTPEGRYTPDGKLGRFRRTLARLAPLADIWLGAISYDVFVGRRLSQLVRRIKPADPSDLRTSLAAARPVTTSQLLADWLVQRPDTAFEQREAVAAVRGALSRLTPSAFVDPELAHAPDKMVRAALRKLVRLRIAACELGRYRLTGRRTHPAFPKVRDIIAFQANELAETSAAVARLDLAATAPTGAAIRLRAR